MWIGNNVTRSCHDQHEMFCGFEQMINDDVMIYFEGLSELEQMKKMLS
jgi:hypothetical protein